MAQTSPSHALRTVAPAFDHPRPADRPAGTDPRVVAGPTGTDGSAQPAATGPIHPGPADQVWATPALGTTVGLRLALDVALIHVSGRLDAVALQPCRAALDAATASRRRIVIDLERAAAAAPVTAALLGAMRRYALSRGSSIVFVNVPADLRPALEAIDPPEAHLLRRTRGNPIQRSVATGGWDQTRRRGLDHDGDGRRQSVSSRAVAGDRS
jgi:anti-anti-sigma regulatory factor